MKKGFRLVTDWGDVVAVVPTMEKAEEYILNEAKKLWNTHLDKLKKYGADAPCNKNLTSFEKALKRCRGFYTIK